MLETNVECTAKPAQIELPSRSAGAAARQPVGLRGSAQDAKRRCAAPASSFGC